MRPKEISAAERMRLAEEAEQKASAQDAFFINMDKGVLDILRQDATDTFRKNNIP